MIEELRVLLPFRLLPSFQKQLFSAREVDHLARKRSVRASRSKRFRNGAG